MTSPALTLRQLSAAEARALHRLTVMHSDDWRTLLAEEVGRYRELLAEARSA